MRGSATQRTPSADTCRLSGLQPNRRRTDEQPITLFEPESEQTRQRAVDRVPVKLDEAQRCTATPHLTTAEPTSSSGMIIRNTLTVRRINETERAHRRRFRYYDRRDLQASALPVSQIQAVRPWNRAENLLAVSQCRELRVYCRYACEHSCCFAQRRSPAVPLEIRLRRIGAVELIDDLVGSGEKRLRSCDVLGSVHGTIVPGSPTAHRSRRAMQRHNGVSSSNWGCLAISRAESGSPRPHKRGLPVANFR